MKLIEEKDKWIVVGQVQCSACQGTGLYVGFAEKDGAAVVCNNCHGKGSVEFSHEYNKFDKRLERKDVKRVYKTGCGYVITPEDIDVTENGTKKTIRFSEGGASYDEWINGVEPEPIRDLHCPYMHTNQMLQTLDVNNLYKTRCRNGLLCGYISDCKHFKDKDTCWDIYEGGEELEKYEE